MGSNKPKVGRHSRMRRSRAGEPLSLLDRVVWREKTLSLLQSRKRKRGERHTDNVGKAKRLKTQPRLASLDWLYDVQNALAIGIGRGLESFRQSDPGRDSVSELTPGEDPDPPLLVFGAMDQEGKQRAACFFLAYALRLRVVRPPPLNHRKCNDVELCITRSGLRAAWHRRLVIENCRYGPWNGSL